jgi:hypothetical protein
MSADDVCSDESVGRNNRSIHVRFRGEMHDGVDAMIAQHELDHELITDIAVNEVEPPALLQG